MPISRVAAVVTVGAGLAASGALLVQAWGGDPGGASSEPIPDEALICSIGSVPTLDAAAVPQAELVEGAPYVALCVDETGQETVFAFIHRAG
jgi:hypothetical protein